MIPFDKFFLTTIYFDNLKYAFLYRFIFGNLNKLIGKITYAFLYRFIFGNLKSVRCF